MREALVLIVFVLIKIEDWLLFNLHEFFTVSALVFFNKVLQKHDPLVFLSIDMRFESILFLLSIK